MKNLSFPKQQVTVLLLCLRASTAIPIEDDADRSPLPGNTGASHLAAEHLLSDWKENTVDTSRDENVANEKKTTSQQLQDQAELYTEERRHEGSCVAKHFFEFCDGTWVKTYECKDTSFTACHNSTLTIWLSINHKWWCHKQSWKRMGSDSWNRRFLLMTWTDRWKCHK